MADETILSTFERSVKDEFVSNITSYSDTMLTLLAAAIVTEQKWREIEKAQEKA